MTGYLWHVTLDTGDVLRVPRGEMPEGLLVTIGEHVGRAIANGPDPIPEAPDYRLMASVASGCLIGTILDGSAPVLTFGVAAKSLRSGSLWQMLHEGRHYPTADRPAPQTPWLGVRFDLPDRVIKIAGWAARYEQLVAWAWVDGNVRAA